MKSLGGNHKSLNCPELIQWNKGLGTKLSVMISNTHIFCSHLLFLKDSPLQVTRVAFPSYYPLSWGWILMVLNHLRKNTSWIPQQVHEKDQIKQRAWAIPPSPALQSPPQNQPAANSSLTGSQRRWEKRWPPAGPRCWNSSCRRSPCGGKPRRQSSAGSTNTLCHQQLPRSQTHLAMLRVDNWGGGSISIVGRQFTPRPQRRSWAPMERKESEKDSKITVKGLTKEREENMHFKCTGYITFRISKAAESLFAKSTLCNHMLFPFSSVTEDTWVT